METDDRRKFTRIPKQELPDFFKKLIIEVGNIKNVEAEAIDATVEGIAIRISGKYNNFKIDDTIILHSSNNHFQFRGKIVNIAPIDNADTRIGIQFC